MSLAPALLFSLALACFDKGKEDDDDDDGGAAGEDSDGDGHDSIESGGTDCDDADATVNPYADELCNGRDDDCDGAVDEDSAVDAPMWCPDADEDGWGDELLADRACEAPEAGWIQQCGDCDDADARFHPEAVEDDCTDPADYDCDGTTAWADADADGHAACEDCDDTDPAVNAAAREVCDGVDNDCDALVDDADDSLDLSTRGTWYPDEDADGFGDGREPVLACGSEGRADNALDCDDTDPLVHPDATELCDALDVDEDCDGLVDDDDPSLAAGGRTAWYPDGDRDGHGAEDGVPVEACDDPSTGGTRYAAGADDCDDGDPGISPSAAEVCDPADTDEDCDGLADDADSSVTYGAEHRWYRDGDEDGHGAGAATEACDDPSTASVAYVTVDDDCDDGDAAVSPSADEVCDPDDTDEDCDGLVDDADGSLDPDSALAWHHDGDGDTYGDPADVRYACADPGATWVDDASDCDDADDDVHPGATEVCDLSDNDCDPSTEVVGVKFTSSAGATTDLTRTFSTTSYGSWSSTAAGTLLLCGDVTWRTAIELYDSVTVVARGDVVIEGDEGAALTVTGASVDAVVQGDLTLTGASISGVYCSNASSLELEGVTISGNTSNNGGGMVLSDCPATLVDVRVQDNQAWNYGGGIYLSEGPLVLVDTEISGNSAYNAGGAVYLVGSSGDPGAVSLDGAVIDGNYAAYTGGGFHVSYGTLDCVDSAITSNSVSYGSGSYGGGGAWLDDNTVGLESDGCDWGSGATDNSPEDILLDSGDLSVDVPASGDISCTYRSCD